VQDGQIIVVVSLPAESLEYSMSQAEQHERPLHFTIAAALDAGIARQHKPNEDGLFAMQGIQTEALFLQPFGVFLVADGMGGYAYGQEASALALQVISTFLIPHLLSSTALGQEALLELLMKSVQQANEAVYRRNEQQHSNMGTTVTAALIVGATAYVANVGDSRCYVSRETGELHQITIDHSVAARLVMAGMIPPTEIYTHPKRNQLFRFLGEKASVEIDVFTVLLRAGDQLLLCSDGLWEMVRDPDIQQILSTPLAPASQTVDALIKAALASGGNDNLSAILVCTS
jgi:serine/threonine protein phosphatase PrpC